MQQKIVCYANAIPARSGNSGNNADTINPVLTLARKLLIPRPTELETYYEFYGDIIEEILRVGAEDFGIEQEYLHEWIAEIAGFPFEDECEIECDCPDCLKAKSGDLQ